MAWIITKDHIAQGDEPSRVGTGQWGDERSPSVGDPLQAFAIATRGGTRVPFRLMDEDGERHYDGIFVDLGEEDALGEGCWGSEEQAWRWGMYDSGATEYMTRTHAWNDRDKTGPVEWRPVFG